MLPDDGSLKESQMPCCYLHVAAVVTVAVAAVVAVVAAAVAVTVVAAVDAAIVALINSCRARSLQHWTLHL